MLIYFVLIFTICIKLIVELIKDETMIYLLILVGLKNESI